MPQECDDFLNNAKLAIFSADVSMHKFCAKQYFKQQIFSSLHALKKTNN